ncbi:hypothetical protein [Brevibacillus agri]|uniref:hypothetical protein n=1 Tax=Brevibacillus agri TaxID=51101 RepID=UPI003D1D232A
MATVFFICSAAPNQGSECDHSKTQHTGGAFFFQSSNFFITGMAPFSGWFLVGQAAQTKKKAHHN